MQQIREAYGPDQVILIDNGDLFQGTPMDVSFFFTTLLIGMVQVILASIPM